MIWVINHAELDLNHCMIFVNIFSIKQNLEKDMGQGVR